MVRIKWNSKPKVKDGEIVFEKSGRSSRVVNHWMNRLLTTLDHGCNQADMIQTGNAGEHAMSVDYALELRFATGYAVEPFQLIDTWERLASFMPVDVQCMDEPCNSVAPRYSIQADDEESYNSSDESNAANSSPPSTLPTPPSSRRPSFRTSPPSLHTAQKVRVLQIESRNPHFHDTGKGADHISKMQAEGLSTIYHSTITPPQLKSELREYMKANLLGVAGVSEDGEPTAPRTYPALRSLDFPVFRATIETGVTTLQIIGNDAKTAFT